MKKSKPKLLRGKKLTKKLDDKIREIVKSKDNWIREKIQHIQKYNDQPHPPGKELVNGESVLYMGRLYQIEIVGEGLSDICFEQRFLIPVTVAKNGKSALRRWYISRAIEKIIPRAKLFANTLGVKYSNIKIVNTQFRWGSCSPNNNVSFNWRLIKAPMFVIDYVIVHELAHLLESNHSVRFWNIVRAQSPNMEKAKQWLLEYGQLLEEDI